MTDRIQFAPALPQMLIREVGDNDSPCVDYDFPTREDVLAMKVGDRALSPFGKLCEIVRIIRIVEEDYEGKAVAHYEVRFSPKSTISMRRREGEITRTVPVTWHHTSNELWQMDRELARLV